LRIIRVHAIYFIERFLGSHPCNLPPVIVTSIVQISSKFAHSETPELVNPWGFHPNLHIQIVWNLTDPRLKINFPPLQTLELAKPRASHQTNNALRPLMWTTPNALARVNASMTSNVEAELARPAVTQCIPTLPYRSRVISTIHQVCQ
jgi:hypothetical protein